MYDNFAIKCLTLSQLDILIDNNYTNVFNVAYEQSYYYRAKANLNEIRMTVYSTMLTCYGSHNRCQYCSIKIINVPEYLYAFANDINSSHQKQPSERARN